MKPILTLFAFLCISVVTFGQIAPDLIGTWRGEVIEPGRSDWYPVVLTISQGTSGEVVATIFYPAYSCGGELTLVQTIRNDGVVMEEGLTEGVFSCINHGKVEIRMSEGYTDRAHFKWSHSAYSHVAIGVILKQEL